jgi:trehalose/maltose hydrolase-like predicted phosphorylase
MRVTDGQGRRTLVSERRIVSMAMPHLAAQEVQITAANWSGELHVCVGLDARVANLNVRADRGFNSQHLIEAVGVALNPESVRLEVQTSQSRIHIAQASRTRTTVEGLPIEARSLERPDFIGRSSPEVREVRRHIEKIAALHVRDPPSASPGGAAADGARGHLRHLLASHAAAWQRLWSRFQFDVGDMHADKGARLRVHTLQTLAAHHGDRRRRRRAGCTARATRPCSGRCARPPLSYRHPSY